MSNKYLEGYQEAKDKQAKQKSENETKRDYHYALVAKYERLIEEHKKKAEKYPYFVPCDISWLDILNRLCDDVSAIIGLPHSKADRTFGLRCEAFVTWSKDPENDPCEDVKYFLCVTPTNTESADTFQLDYDTGEKKGKFARNSIGELNGFDNVTAPLPLDAEKVAEILKEHANR